MPIEVQQSAAPPICKKKYGYFIFLMVSLLCSNLLGGGDHVVKLDLVLVGSACFEIQLSRFLCSNPELIFKRRSVPIEVQQQKGGGDQ